MMLSFQADDGGDLRREFFVCAAVGDGAEDRQWRWPDPVLAQEDQRPRKLVPRVRRSRRCRFVLASMVVQEGGLGVRPAKPERDKRVIYSETNRTPRKGIPRGHVAALARLLSLL